MVQVRVATAADTDAVADTVAAAFADDPAWSFITDNGGDAVRRAFATALFLPRARRGTAWVTDDCAAVAMWDRFAAEWVADDDHDSVWGEFRALAGEVVWERLQAYDGALSACEPERPFWYLGVLATRPEVQGRGLATAVLAPGLAAADAEGWDCWLETSTPANKAFYAGRGFTEGREVDIPGGPPTWWLRRPRQD